MPPRSSVPALVVLLLCGCGSDVVEPPELTEYQLPRLHETQNCANLDHEVESPAQGGVPDKEAVLAHLRGEPFWLFE